MAKANDTIAANLRAYNDQYGALLVTQGFKLERRAELVVLFRTDTEAHASALVRRLGMLGFSTTRMRSV